MVRDYALNHFSWSSLNFDRFKETGNREKIFLATKFGTVGTPERVINGEPEYIKVAVERSLKKLGIDTIDLYYLHVRFYFITQSIF